MPTFCKVKGGDCASGRLSRIEILKLPIPRAPPPVGSAASLALTPIIGRVECIDISHLGLP